MKNRVVHILTAYAVLFTLIGCSFNKAKIISRGDMAEIYAEMLMADQWIIENSRTRTQADTSLVYEPIFQSYGYDTEDYRASVAYYMKDPERYSRILRTTAEILDAKIVELKELKRIEDRRKAVVPYKIDRFRLYYVRSVEGLWEYGDSVSVELDSLVPVLEMHMHETSDTLYEGLNMIVRTDSLAVKDSILQVKDTIKKVEDEIVKKGAVSKMSEKVAPVKKDTLIRKRGELLKVLSEVNLDSLKRK